MYNMETESLLSGMDNQLLEEYEVLRTGSRLNMRYWDDETLKTVCKKVNADEFDGRLREFGTLLLGTLAAHGNGLGLAANQVGLTRRMFAIRFSGEGTEDLNPFVMVNPLIVNASDETEVGQEGCLSVPTIYDQVRRARSITVEFQYIDGKEGKYDLEGIDARVVQHEVDHLNGLMFFDRMSKQMRKAVLRQWAKIEDRYVR